MKIETFFDGSIEQISVDGQMYDFKNVRVDDEGWSVSWKDVYGAWHLEPELFIRDEFIDLTVAMLGEVQGRYLLAETNAEVLTKYIRQHIQRSAN